jgi:hypothetical protein
LKFERESLSSRSLGQWIFKSMEWPNELRGWRPPIIPLTGNLPIGVSEIRTCLVQGSGISEKGYWNPVWAPDKSGAPRLSMGKAVGPDMSGSGTRYVRRTSLKPRDPIGQVWPKDLAVERKWLTVYVKSRD